MNIYRNASNKIALSTFPSIEGGYILLRFTRGTSNVYAISANIVSEEFPMVAQITEIGSGTPVPADGEVLLDAGKWTCYAYEQVSATNYNPDCPERFLEEIPINVFGDAAAVLNQTPAACPSGSGAVDSVNGQTGTVVVDAPDVDAVDYFLLTCGEFPQGVIMRKAGTSNGKDYYEDPADSSNLVAWVPSQWRILVGGVLKYTSADAVADPTLVTTWSNSSGGALPLPTTSDLYTGTIQEVVEALATRQGPREAVWEGFITQVGTAAPTVVDLTNTLGGVPVLTYDTPGTYIATLASAFPVAKTSQFLGLVGPSPSPIGDGSVLVMYPEGGNDIIIKSGVVAGATGDDLLSGAYFRITVKR